MMTRSPEEKEQANVRLREAYGDLVGDYKLASGSMTGTPITFSIDEGGIKFSLAGQPPDFLTEPDEEDRMYVMSNRQLYMTVKHNDAGDGYDIVLFAYGDEFGRIERVEGE